ncbi:glycoside hydrolase family 26 protein [Phenylobacterium soli]|uniref:GH26 domain-containing protein n=1 Tax=Phenylobacterium soli TaxID=2170551 RepID=A0A328AFX7_9CAUL|nr:hypothetical protein [Phenylobacterium soli]RAK53773.1 hypothetical protein DJ017_04140 [Phenylobacterium soli]
MRERLQNLSRRTLLQGSLAAGGAAAIVTAGVGAGPALAQATGAGRDVTRDKRPVTYPDGLKLGAYDPYGDFKDEAGLATEHLFLPWEDVELGALAAADSYALQRGRNVLVTIEPWSWAKDFNTSPAQLRNAILSGQRDDNMRAILNVLAKFKSPVTIRWAQEMDNRFSRFIWAAWAGPDYVKAFQRMAGLIRTVTPKAQIMWSPRGERTLGGYYPGSKYVDVIGLTVFGLEKFDMLEYGHARSFAESVNQGYSLTAGYGKPVWVAELGYDGSPAYVSKWAQEVAQKRPEFPQLKEVVYFNDREVWPWPRNLGRPDWRVVAERPFLYPLRERP